MFLTKEDLLRLACAYSKLPILEEVAAKKAKIDALQNVISQDQRLRLDQKVRLDWNFHSNCIEGNSLDYGQTTAFLMYGFTAKGKPFKDYVDIKGHNEVMDAIIELAKKPNLQLSQRDLREFHSVLLVESYEVKTESITGLPTRKTIQIGEYKTMPNHVKTQTGKTHFYALPEEVPALMTELLDFYHEAKTDADIHPLVVAALLHYQFVAIHPFDDGNGRMSRLLMNLVLMQNHLQPVIIRSEKEAKNAYYAALSDADNGNHETFINLIAEYELAACDLFIKAAHNESIEEPDDIDKEIALLEQSLKTQEDYIEKFFSPENVKEAFKNGTFKVIERLAILQAKYKNLFEILEYGSVRLGSKINRDGDQVDAYYYLSNYADFFFDVERNSIGNEIDDTLECDFSFYDYKNKINPFSFLLSITMKLEKAQYVLKISMLSLKNSINETLYEKQHKYNEVFNDALINNIYNTVGKAINDTIKKLAQA